MDLLKEKEEHEIIHKDFDPDGIVFQADLDIEKILEDKPKHLLCLKQSKEADTDVTFIENNFHNDFYFDAGGECEIPTIVSEDILFLNAILEENEPLNLSEGEINV